MFLCEKFTKHPGKGRVVHGVDEFKSFPPTTKTSLRSLTLQTDVTSTNSTLCDLSHISFWLSIPHRRQNKNFLTSKKLIFFLYARVLKFFETFVVSSYGFHFQEGKQSQEGTEGVSIRFKRIHKKVYTRYIYVCTRHILYV